MKRFWSLTFLLTGAAALASDGVVNIPDVQPDAQVAVVLQHLNEVHESLVALSAEVTQIKQSALLAAPVVSKGTLRYQAPDSVRWDYGAPDPMVMLIHGGEMTMYYPDLQRADVVDVRRYQGQLFQVMGIGQSSQVLEKHYQIRYIGRHEPGVKGGGKVLPEELQADPPPASPPEGALTLLEMLPKRRRLRRRIESIRLWASEKTWYPAMLRIQEASGDSSLVIFRSFDQREAFPPETFQLDLPEDVTVSRRKTGRTDER